MCSTLIFVLLTCRYAPYPWIFHIKGLSHEMDLAFEKNEWSVLGLNKGRGHLFKFFSCSNDCLKQKVQVYVGVIIEIMISNI